uniref:Uncharacterized protein n=1 Tax=Zonotrichia albicollis TaxID=44394 RepID=A0A8D2QEK3_ZONAL
LLDKPVIPGIPAAGWDGFPLSIPKVLCIHPWTILEVLPEPLWRGWAEISAGRNSLKFIKIHSNSLKFIKITPGVSSTSGQPRSAPGNGFGIFILCLPPLFGNPHPAPEGKDCPSLAGAH